MKRTTVDSLVATETGMGEKLNRQILTKWQFERLRETLHNALSSPFYRKRFAGLSKEKINTIHNPDDLVRLPLMTENDLRREGLNLLTCSQSEVARLVTLQTSGSTGKPKRLAFTRQDLEATSRFFCHGMKTLLREKEQVQVILPADRSDSVADLLLHSLPQTGHPVSIYWPPEKGDKMAAAVCREKANCVIGLPTHLLALAEAANHSHSIRTMLLCSDYAPPALQKRIEATGIQTFIHYGSTESGFGGAVECEAHDGCHLWESELLVEVIDPNSGKPVPDGNPGEIVLTTLRRKAMPLIRLRTGDQGILLRTACLCDGVTARINDVKRRQIFHLPQGKLSGQGLDDLFFAIPGLLDYRAVLTDDGLHIRYLATKKIKNFPPLPAGLRYKSIEEVFSLQDNPSQKRLVQDLRRVSGLSALHSS